MSNPTAGEVLALLAEYLETRALWPSPFRYSDTEAGRIEHNRLIEADKVAYGSLVAINPAHLRTLAAALSAPAEAGAGEGEPNAADHLEDAYERFSGKFGVRFPFVEDDRCFMVPTDDVEIFQTAFEAGIAEFRAALAPSPAPDDA